MSPGATTPLPNLQHALKSYFAYTKGGGDAGDLLAMCATVAEVPAYVRDTLLSIATTVEPPPPHLDPVPLASAPVIVATQATGTGIPPLPSTGAQAYTRFVPHAPKSKV